MSEWTDFLDDIKRRLKPCPFCGGKPRMDQHGSNGDPIDDDSYPVIECRRCGCGTTRLSIEKIEDELDFGECNLTNIWKGLLAIWNARE